VVCVADEVESADWVDAYVEGYRQTGAFLDGIRSRQERANSCLAVLIAASQSLTSRAPAAIAAPSAERGMVLGQIAGMAAAASTVIKQGRANAAFGELPDFRDRLTETLIKDSGLLARGLMAASDGEMRILLATGTVSELQVTERTDGIGLPDSAHKIMAAAQLLAELSTAASPRSAEVHRARAQALDRKIAAKHPEEHARISAHGSAVHYLTSPGADRALENGMLRLIAKHPPHDRATLQASKVAGLLSDWRAPATRMRLLALILRMLGPDDRHRSVTDAVARDCALVLLLLDDDLSESDGAPIPKPVDRAEPPTSEPLKRSTSRAPFQPDFCAFVTSEIAKIAKTADHAVGSASTDRAARYAQVVATGSLTDALVIVQDAAADDDHEQAWTLFTDIAERHHESNPEELVTVAWNVLDEVPVDSDGVFDGPGAGCFTVLSPDPAKAAAAVSEVLERLMNVDERGIEHSDSAIARSEGYYTPNYLFDLMWCDRGAKISLDTKGVMPTPMARGILAIITNALVHSRVPALITGDIPALDSRMTRWDDQA
jgi:hypothetical protein